jgi:hypothetical protein
MKTYIYKASLQKDISYAYLNIYIVFLQACPV